MLNQVPNGFPGIRILPLMPHTDGRAAEEQDLLSERDISFILRLSYYAYNSTGRHIQAIWNVPCLNKKLKLKSLCSQLQPLQESQTYTKVEGNRNGPHCHAGPVARFEDRSRLKLPGQQRGPDQRRFISKSIWRIISLSSHLGISW